MTAPGTRYERTDEHLLARVREVRARLDRQDPLSAKTLIASRRERA